MASIYKDTSRNGWRVQIYLRGHRRKLWLGPVSKTQAKHVAGHLEQLNLARETQTQPPESTQLWAATVGPRIKQRLIDWGLVLTDSRAAQIPLQLAAYVDWYIADHPEWKPSTQNRWRTVKQRLICHFGRSTPINTLSAGSADAFARHCRSQYADSHAGKLIADARQCFAAAVKYRILATNPFTGLDSRQRHDKTREAYVTRETVAALLEHSCPYFAAVIALARYAGLRIPSEPLALEWQHVDWHQHRLTVAAPKTGTTRIIPIAAELFPYLSTIYESAPPGSRYICDRYRTTAGKVWRQNLLRICKLAGIAPWPKLWMNMRASCRTDLLATHPAHVVNYWLGHSGQIGAQHYDRVTEDHYKLACGVAGGVAQPPAASSTRPAKRETPGN